MEVPTLGILAGGRATRMGSLGQKLSKALISPGQTPIMVHQLRIARNAGISRAIIAVAPRWKEQISEVLDGPAGTILKDVHIVVEPEPLGPGPGVATIAQAVGNAPLLLLLADTWLTELPDTGGADWVAVAPAPFSRRWCKPDRGAYLETHSDAGEFVAVGAYRFSDTRWLSACAKQNGDRGQEELSALLNSYQTRHPLADLAIDDWVDVGTLETIQAAHHLKCPTRPSNAILMHPDGFITKRSQSTDFATEREYVLGLHGASERLFPRVSEAGPAAYDIEYLDLPTLAHLYLYWKTPGSEWARLLDRLLQRLKRDLWGGIKSPQDVADSQRWAREVFVDKLWRRLAQWNHPILRHKRLSINNASLSAGYDMIQQLTERLTLSCSRADPATIHGDLNFCNILYSENTGVFRLLDPTGHHRQYRRGLGRVQDCRYDLAKLRYSYGESGEFSRICDELFRLSGSANSWETTLFNSTPSQRLAASAMDRVIARYADLDELDLIQASILLSAPPLHYNSERQQIALYLSGVQLANRHLNG